MKVHYIHLTCIKTIYFGSNLIGQLLSDA